MKSKPTKGDKVHIKGWGDGEILQVGKVGMSAKGDINTGEPTEPFHESQEIYVLIKHPKTGKTVKMWFNIDLIK